MSRTQALLATAAAVLLTGCTPLATPPPEALDATVVTVIDGDTLRVTMTGGRETVRLLAIDAPETAHNEHPAQCGAATAHQRLAALAPVGARLRLITDNRSNHRDRYGRILAYAETTTGGLDLGAALIDEGLAAAWHPISSSPPTRFRAYQAAQRTAEQAHRGSWATCAGLGRHRL